MRRADYVSKSLQRIKRRVSQWDAGYISENAESFSSMDGGGGGGTRSRSSVSGHGNGGGGHIKRALLRERWPFWGEGGC